MGEKTLTRPPLAFGRHNAVVQAGLKTDLGDKYPASRIDEHVARASHVGPDVDQLPLGRETLNAAVLAIGDHHHSLAIDRDAVRHVRNWPGPSPGSPHEASSRPSAVKR